MKLSKFLLLGLLGLCVPLTGCSDDEKDPANDPASEEVPHHPTSNFDRCPLLAHIDNPKLGIKEITLERYEDGELAYKEVYSYDKEQRLTKITADNWYNTYEYDAKGRPCKIVERGEDAEFGNWQNVVAYFYDEYGFYTKYTWTSESQDGEYAMEVTYDYVGDTVFMSSKSEGVRTINVYSEDMYPIYSHHIEEGYEDETYYDWENGNRVSVKTGGYENKYTYDDKVNIERLFELFSIGDVNNRLGYWSYTYDGNGMVAAKQTESGTTKEVFTYIYY